MSARLRVSLISLAVLTALASSAWAVEPAPIATSSGDAASGATGPSGSSLDTDFLLLPSFDLGQAPAEGKVGDLIHLQITGLPALESGQSYAVKLPSGNSPLNDQGWEVLPGKSAGPGQFTLTVVPLRPGRLTLPSLAIGATSGKPDEFKAIARTNPLNLQVQSSIRKDDPKPTEPVAPKPPAELAFPWWVVAVMGALIGAVVGAALYGLYRWSRNRKSLMPVKPAEPPRPEDEVALADLLALEKSGALIRGDFKTHYFKTSEILKKYVGARYKFDALESTTREMVAGMPEFAKNHAAALEGIFAKLDRVKFTDQVPSSDEAGALIGEARKFVIETRQKSFPLEASPVSVASAGKDMAK